MRLQLSNIQPVRLGLIILAILGAIAAALSGYLIPSTYAPLIVAGVGASLMVLSVGIQRPVLALYAALLVILLPIGLIPPDIHSILNRTFTLLALGVWLFNVITSRYEIRTTPTTFLMLGFLVWCMLSLFWTVDTSQSIHNLQLYMLRFALYFLLLPNVIRTFKDLDGLMKTLALSGWITVMVCLGVVVAEGYLPGTRLMVLEMNANGIGIILLITFTGVIWVAGNPTRNKKFLKMILAFCFLCASIGIIAMSGSRGSAISLVLMLIALSLLRRTRIWGLIGLTILVLGIVIAPILFTTTFQRFAIERGDTLLGGREQLWQGVLMLIQDRPWLGVGIGNSPTSVMTYLSSYRSLLEYEMAAIHNPVLTIWAETGLPGILLYLSLLASALIAFLVAYNRHRRLGRDELMLYFALMMALFVGYMASWIKGGGMESDQTYFLILAMLVIPSYLSLPTPERI